MPNSSALKVTESLANGLKNRFFSELILARKKFNTLLIDDPNEPKNWREFEKFIIKARGAYKGFALLEYVGGSKRKPYVAFEMLNILTERPYNSWNEKCVFGQTVAFGSSPFSAHTNTAPYSISEHTIARLYLRTKPVFDGEIIDYEYIIDELKHIPLWAGFWSISLMLNQQNDFSDRIFPILPAESGLFMCEFKQDTKIMEIRTFVEDASLTFEQIESKNLLLEISKEFDNSPLSVWSGLQKYNLDVAGASTLPISHIMLNDKRFPNLMNVIFYRVMEDSERYILKNLFVNYLKSQNKNFNELLLDEIRRVGIRQYNVNMNAIISKNGYLAG